MKRLALLLLCCACAPRVPRAETPKELSPLKLFPLRQADVGWAEDLEGSENRFLLNVLGITAADPQHVFVYGNLRIAGRSYRSLLLASDDGGLSFRERMPPYETSEVTRVQFIGCTGWALVGWRQEAPGDLTLLGSGDCGASWFTLSELPKLDDSGWPVSLEFDDTFNGVITLAYDDRRRGFLRTHDGGRTWTEGYGRARPDEPGRVQRLYESTDAGQWKIDSAEDRYAVRHRASAQQLWTVTAILPMALRFEGGDLLPVTGK